MRGSSASSVLANPVLVGAVTLLVTVIAVFLAYNSNAGLPFVPTTELNVLAPNGARLVAANDVREGGQRIGQVSEIVTKRRADGSTGALLTLQLDKTATPLPADSTVQIRPKSTLGLKYLDITKGKSKKLLADGATVTIDSTALAPELDTFFDVFDPETRLNVRRNLAYFAAAFAGRGNDLNRTIAAAPQTLDRLIPVAQNLSNPNTQLRNLINQLETFMRIVAPVSDDLVAGFGSGATTFAAISRDPKALQDSIAEGPKTLEVATRSLRAQRPFLRNLASLSTQVNNASAEIRRSTPPISSALRVGTPVLRRTPRLNRQLGNAFDSLRTFSTAPTTNLGLAGLTSTVDILNPAVRYLGPYVTVCNYWNYWWTYLDADVAEPNDSGTLQRVLAKQAGNGMDQFGAVRPANGQPQDPLTTELKGDPPALHAQPYGAAVDDKGNADCEVGQRGYPKRLAKGVDPSLNIAIDPHTPGDQGPTFTGRPRVPAGQTFTRSPETGAQVLP